MKNFTYLRFFMCEPANKNEKALNLTTRAVKEKNSNYPVQK